MTSGMQVDPQRWINKLIERIAQLEAETTRSAAIIEQLSERTDQPDEPGVTPPAT